MDFFSDMRLKSLVGYDRFDEMRKKTTSITPVVPRYVDNVLHLFHFDGTTYDEVTGYTYTDISNGAYTNGKFSQCINKVFFPGADLVAGQTGEIYRGYGIARGTFPSGGSGERYDYGIMNNTVIAFWLKLPDSTLTQAKVQFGNLNRGNEGYFEIATVSQSSAKHEIIFKQIGLLQQSPQTSSATVLDTQTITEGTVPGLDLTPGKWIYISFVISATGGISVVSYTTTMYANGIQCFSTSKTPRTHANTGTSTNYNNAFQSNTLVDELLVCCYKTGQTFDHTPPTVPFSVASCWVMTLDGYEFEQRYPPTE